MFNSIQGLRPCPLNRVQALQDLQPQSTVTQILSILDLMGFFCHCIPNFAITVKPLYQAAREWPVTHLAIIFLNFSLLKDALVTVSALVLPYPTRSYHLYTVERLGVATGVLTQLVGPLN